jgi:hypothetical protein
MHGEKRTGHKSNLREYLPTESPDIFYHVYFTNLTLYYFKNNLHEKPIMKAIIFNV